MEPPETAFHGGSEYELLPNAQASDDHSERQSTYSGIKGDAHSTTGFVRHQGVRYGLHSFILHSPMMMTAFVLGLCLTLACFAFTYWLSLQIFDCPAWSLDCEVTSSVRYFVANLNQVQGVLSTVFGIGISMIAYVTYQLAETTLWPTLTTRTFELQHIDRFITAARGSLSASAKALMHVRSIQHTAVVLIVGIIALLLQVNSTIIGYAFKLVDIPTDILSNHTIGGGMGFGYSQTSPASAFPGAVGDAQNVYAAWSSGWSQEPMPEQRHFIVDRSNISEVGDVSINAVEARRTVNCSAMPINIASVEESYNGDPQMSISPTYGDDVWVRVQPVLSLWVDNYGADTKFSSWSRIVFAAFNGSIEGGHHTPAPSEMITTNPERNYTNGISTLACDVNVTLVDSKFCTGRCQQEYTTLQSIETLSSHGSNAFRPPYDRTVIANWLSLAVVAYGTSVNGAQPCFAPGKPNNVSLPLPIAYTSEGVYGTSYDWTQAELTNFMDVGSGAMSMIMTHSWMLNETANVTVSSSLEMLRMDTTRSVLLLIPIGIVLLSLVLLAVLIEIMYRQTGVDVVRLGSVGEVLIASQTSDVHASVREFKEGRTNRKQFAETKFRYGILPDGTDGLGRRDHVRTFSQTW